MLNHLPPLHDQKHIRSSVCRHHRHHGALPNAHEDTEDLESRVCHHHGALANAHEDHEDLGRE